jgi:hypothetical protein
MIGSDRYPCHPRNPSFKPCLGWREIGSGGMWIRTEAFKAAEGFTADYADSADDREDDIRG